MRLLNLEWGIVCNYEKFIITGSLAASRADVIKYESHGRLLKRVLMLFSGDTVVTSFCIFTVLFTPQHNCILPAIAVVVTHW